MKKFAAILGAALVAAAMLSCDKDKPKDDGSGDGSGEVVDDGIVHVEGVSLEFDEYRIEKGHALILRARIIPENATDQNVSWEVRGDSKLHLEEERGLTAVFDAKAPGEATVTVTTNDGHFSASCKVTVVEKEVLPTGISFSCPSVLAVGETTDGIRVSFTPADTDYKICLAGSDNTSVLEVVQQPVQAMGYAFRLKGVSAGTANVLVKAYNNVEKTVPVAVGDISWNPGDITLQQGESCLIPFAEVSGLSKDDSYVNYYLIHSAADGAPMDTQEPTEKRIGAEKVSAIYFLSNGSSATYHAAITAQRQADGIWVYAQKNQPDLYVGRYYDNRYTVTIEARVAVHETIKASVPINTKP